MDATWKELKSCAPFQVFVPRTRTMRRWLVEYIARFGHRPFSNQAIRYVRIIRPEFKEMAMVNAIRVACAIQTEPTSWPKLLTQHRQVLDGKFVTKNGNKVQHNKQQADRFLESDTDRLTRIYMEMIHMNALDNMCWRIAMDQGAIPLQWNDEATYIFKDMDEKTVTWTQEKLPIVAMLKKLMN